jgi:hypothetical protein
MPRPLRKHAKVLHVAGTDDKEVVYQFCNRRGIDNLGFFEVVGSLVQVEDSRADERRRGGYDGLRARVIEELKTDRDTIGIIVDADTDLPSRWRSLRDVLVSHYGQREPRQSVPEHLEPGGLIVESGAWWQKRCGVWVMPDNARGGMLEDFLLALIPDADVLLTHAQHAVATLPKTEFKPEHRAKAQIHTWLAWQKQPGTPLGLALRRHYLDGDHALAQRFHDWLVALFEIPSPGV